MKRHSDLLKIVFSILFIVYLTGCNEQPYYYDNMPPNPPENVRTFVGNNQVEIEWNHSPENDVSGYNVYYSTTYWGEYTLIGYTSNNYYVDFDAINGEIYYYAVAAYDYDGNESELSYDEVYGVARPEGKNLSIYDFRSFPDASGYDFSEYLVVPYNAADDNASSDLFFENFDGIFYLNVWDDSDIQDMGYTNSFLDITYAPLSGWMELQPGENVKYIEAVLGHTYVIWTWDNHFAKVRIKSISNERIVFDWAYQLLEGEQQLKTSKDSSKRGNIPSTVIKN